MVIGNVARGRKGPKITGLVAKTAIASGGVCDLRVAEVHFEAVQATVAGSSVEGETGPADGIHLALCEAEEVEACFLSCDGHLAMSMKEEDVVSRCG